MKRTRNIVAGIALGFSLTFCGQVLNNGDIDTSSDAASSDTSISTSDDNLVSFEVQVVEKERPLGLSLTAAADEFDLTLDSCATGNTATITEADPVVRAFKKDTGCLIKPTEIVSNGTTFQPSAGDPFTTFQAGDVATFEDTSTPDPGHTIQVTIVSTLSDPIGDGGNNSETITIQFEEVKKESTTDITSIVAASHTLSVAGEEAPAFDIGLVNYVSLTAGGVGQFTMKLNCTDSGDQVTSTAGTETCHNQQLQDLEYKLIGDADGSLTLAEAKAAMASGTSTISFPTDVTTVADSDADLPGGGFITSLLDGPGPLHTNTKMLLIVSIDDKGFVYFELDINLASL